MGHNGRRTGVIAILVLGVVAILLLLYFLFRGGPAPEPVNPAEELPEPAQTVRDVPEAPAVVSTPGEASAQVVVRNFIERFGTYSTDVPYQNFDDVADLVTDSYRVTLDASRSGEVSDTYRGVTTRVLSMTQVSGTEASGRIVYDISAQREATTAERAQSEITYEPGQVVVLKVGESWLVD